MRSSRADEDTVDRPAKIRRTTLACSRCQARKVRCDNGVPKCSNCKRAGSDCTDGKSTHDGGISRAEAAALHAKIEQLQQLLAAKQANIDANDLPATNGQAVAQSQYAPADSNAATDAVSTSPVQPVATLVSQGLNGALPNYIAQQADSEVVHQIGLVPLSSGGEKYIGTSSGFTCANLVFAKAGRKQPTTNAKRARGSARVASHLRWRPALQVTATALPDELEDALQLSEAYFEFIHCQYPFLQRHRHIDHVRSLYGKGKLDSTTRFQVLMVLAISAVILSRRTDVGLSGEGMAATAMQMTKDIDFQSTVQGMHCLSLIYIYTLHSPSLNINPWFLNYQSLGSVLDLGLQRDVPPSPSLSEEARGIRTWTFWVAYSVDRYLATILGRPIGLRDEGCDLRLPSLDMIVRHQTQGATTTDDRTLLGAVKQFKLALLNSEMKYILHSITRDVPRYTYPSIPDIDTWQADIYDRLQTLQQEDAGDVYMATICDIRYHELVMLLFRPSARIRKPSEAALATCKTSADAAIRLWNELYENETLVYPWTMVQSICLSAVTSLYCIWMSPDIAAATKVDQLTAVTSTATNLLSVAGEHWPDARKSRDSLQHLIFSTVRWLLDLQLHRRTGNVQPSTATGLPQQDYGFGVDLPSFDEYLNTDDFGTLFGAPDLFSTDFPSAMDGMFTEFQPSFDFEPYTDKCFGSFGAEMS